MGIPKFYRWLRRRYPMAVRRVEGDEDVPPVDNLYLDMNGLVHMVIHGNDNDTHVLSSRLLKEDKAEELWCQLFRYIDDLVHLVNPRRLLFLALDSVTPVAKMTQQRARRMKNAQNLKNLAHTAPEHGEVKLFDINAISPGSEFMAELNHKLDFFLQQKVHDDPAYQGLRVVFSDSNVPGEGEHKIMEYLRRFKLCPEYDPNIRHCVYGLDADLIMLALVSHEPHMLIIREVVEPRPPNQQVAKGIVRSKLLKEQEFEILYISILREYFELEYKELASQLSFKFDLERIIDDFIFFSLFVGNDFVPYLNTVDISYGSLDEVIRLYKGLLPRLSDYVTLKGNIIWSNAKVVFAELGKSELQHLRERAAESTRTPTELPNSGLPPEDDVANLVSCLRFEKKLKLFARLRDEGKLADFEQRLKAKAAANPASSAPAASASPEEKQKGTEAGSESPGPQIDEPEELKQEKVAEPRQSAFEPADIPDAEVSEVDEEEIAAATVYSPGSSPAEAVTHNRQFLANLCGLYETDVHQAKHLYYLEKLLMDINTEEGRREQSKLIAKYLEGLQWVLYYYYRGVQHWGWFYSYHYAPLVSDISSVPTIDPEAGPMKFELKEPNNPCTPFEQLLSILPKTSCDLLPQAYHQLYEQSSPIIDFYPETYKVDLNGRALPWEAIKLIPFVDICRMLEAEAMALKKGPALTPSEEARNSLHKAMLYTYDNLGTGGTVASQFKDMPNIEGCRCRKSEFQIAGVPENQDCCFAPVLPAGTRLPCCDFPSLHHVLVQGCRLVKKKGHGTSYESVEVLVDSHIPRHLSTCFYAPVYIGYPGQREAQVVSLIVESKNETVMYCWNTKGNFVINKKMMPNEAAFDAALWETQEQMIAFKPDLKYVAYCQVLSSIQKCPEEGGSYHKVFVQEEILVPGPLLMTSRSKLHYQNCVTGRHITTDLYPIGSPCLCLAENYFGWTGTITQRVNKGHVEVELTRAVDPSAIANLKSFKTSNPVKDSPAALAGGSTQFFVSLNRLTYMLRLSYSTLNRITSSFMVFARKPGQHKSQASKYNIGLGLKSNSLGIHVPHHVFYLEQRNNWFFSPEATSYIQQYVHDYPEVITFIEHMDPYKQAGTVYADRVFPTAAAPEVRLKELLTWLTTLSTSQLPYVPIGSQFISPETKRRIAAQLRKVPDTQPVSQRVVLPLEQVHVETHPHWIRQRPPQHYSTHIPGDRLITIKSSGRGQVPFGMTGTVLGCYSNKLLVEFDLPLITGSSFNGQSAKYCGQLVDVNAVANLSA